MTAIDADSQPRIGRGFRLQWEQAQQAHVLLYPEGMVKLNPSAGQILTRCNGETRLGDIVADLEKTFETTALDDDVVAFLEMARAQNWVEW